MKRIGPKVLSFVVCCAAAGGVSAQDAGETQPREQAQASTERSPAAKPSAPARRTLPQVTGTVLRWTGNRIDLKTRDGKTQKVAVNRDTERLVEISPGAEVTVEYRRRISGFIIAQRVLPAGEQEAARPSTGAEPGRTVTGRVVSWSEAALILRTEAGDVTLFLSPTTEYRVKSLDPGLAVTVEYQEGRDQARLATRVRASGEKEASEPTESPAPPGR